MDLASPQDAALAAMLAADPAAFERYADRLLVEQFGLRQFIELAWPTVEGTNKFKSNWHIDAICEYLEAVSRGEIKRLVIAVPPRHMKSVSVAVMWPAWDWLNNPQRRFLFSSYAYNLAIRDSAKCRRVVTSPWYQARWSDRFRVTSDQNTKQRFDNNKTGYRLATSVNGMLTGEGGDIVVVDDPLNSRDSESELKRERMLTWWNESMSTRLNDPDNGAFVIIQQRLHERDLVGDVLKKHKVKPEGSYEYLCLPARYEEDHPYRWIRDPRKENGQLLWPSHIGEDTLSALEKSLGEYAAAGQLQQRPSPREGGMFKRSWLPIVKSSQVPTDLEFARAWDLAASVRKTVKADPDWTATCMIGWSRSARTWFITHVGRWREDPARVEKLIKQFAETDPISTRVSVPQDPGAAGKAMAQAMLAMLGGFNVRAEPQSGDKVTRATALAAQAGGHNIKLVEGDWNDVFLDEITGFPNGSHDDMVDAAASAFNRLTGGTSGLMEYFARQIDEDKQRLAAAAVRDAKSVDVYKSDGLTIRTEETDNLARALLTGRY